MRPRQRAVKISIKMQCQIQTVQICRKSSKAWTVLLMPTLQTKQCSTMVEVSPSSNPKPTFSKIKIPGSANLPCPKLIEISTDNPRNVSMQQLLMIKAVLHFEWMSYYLLSKRRSSKELLALTTFQLHFSSHSVRRPSRKCYPYSTHPFHLLNVHVSGGSALSLYYWRLGNLLVKLHLSAPSISHFVLSNIVLTTLPKQKTYSVDSKLVIVKVDIARIRLLR